MIEALNFPLRSKSPIPAPRVVLPGLMMGRTPRSRACCPSSLVMDSFFSSSAVWISFLYCSTFSAWDASIVLYRSSNSFEWPSTPSWVTSSNLGSVWWTNSWYKVSVKCCATYSDSSFPLINPNWNRPWIWASVLVTLTNMRRCPSANPPMFPAYRPLLRSNPPNFTFLNRGSIVERSNWILSNMFPIRMASRYISGDLAIRFNLDWLQALRAWSIIL